MTKKTEAEIAELLKVARQWETRRDHIKRTLKKATAEGVHFHAVTGGFRDITFAYVRTGQNLVMVSTAVRNPKDKRDILEGRYQAFASMENNSFVFLYWPKGVSKETFFGNMVYVKG